MKSMMKRLKLTYSMVLLCCLFCGTAAGTILANCLGGQLGELAVYGQMVPGYSALTAGQRRSLWGYTARQRLSELGLAALVGMTPLSAAGFAVFAFAAGAACGLLVSVLTLERGLLGLPAFLLGVFPQWLCYLPVWVFMAVRAGGGLDRLRMRIWILLTVLAGAGIFLEAYINPLLPRF